ncbi:MAG TPA: response regulator [Roseiflexaceae bacterium]|nr:response regulator [Roseiflexaceae bacterium]
MDTAQHSGTPAHPQAGDLLIMLQAITTAMAGTTSLDVLLDRTVAVVHHRLSNISTTILELLAAEQMLYTRACLAELPYSGPMSLATTVGMIGAAARSGTTIVANDTTTNPYFVPTPGWHTGAQLCVPIVTSRSIWGVISLESQHGDAYPPAIVSAIEVVAQQLALAIEHINLAEHAREQAFMLDRRAREQEQFLALNSRLHAGMNLDELLQHIADTISTIVGFQSVVINLIDTSNDLVYVAAVATNDPAGIELLGATYPHRSFLGLDPERFRVSRSYFYPAEAIDSAELIGPTFTPQLDARAPDEWQAEDLLFIPLVSYRDDIIGYLSVDDPQDRRRPTRATIQGLEIYASQVAAAIENTRMFTQLTQAFTDLHAAHKRQNDLIEENRRTQSELLNATKLAAVGTLAAGVAHEFNNLLAAIQGYAELGSSGMMNHPDEAFAIILHAARRGADITRRLLTFARQDEATFQPAAINAIAEEALRLIERELLRVELHVQRDYQTNAMVLADTGQVMQVVLNLLTNARDATPPGGMITISTRLQPPWVELEVRDTGSGIAAGHLEHIFEPFMTTKGPLGGGTLGGTGLGLSVSYGIAQAHNGQLAVESTVGVGSRFILRLPYHAPATTTRQPTAPVALSAPGAQPQHILVVDDEPWVRATISAILTHAGHQVVEVGSGEEALRAFEQRHFDLVISDLTMPKMDGATLTTELRRRDRTLPIILVTGYGDATALERIRGSGAAAVLTKPFDRDKLLAVIEGLPARHTGGSSTPTHDA